MLGLDGGALLPYLRAYRHRVANHVQVAVGWLELGDALKAREALDALRRRLAAEARLAAGVPAPLAGLILGLALEAEEQGIEVDLSVDGMMPGPVTAAAVAGACEAVVQGWARLQSALSGAGVRPEERRLIVRWTRDGVTLEAPAAGLPPVTVPLDRPAVDEPGE